MKFNYIYLLWGRVVRTFPPRSTGYGLVCPMWDRAKWLGVLVSPSHFEGYDYEARFGYPGRINYLLKWMNKLECDDIYRC